MGWVWHPSHTVSQHPRTYYEDSHRSQSTYHSNLRSLRSVSSLVNQYHISCAITKTEPNRSMPVTLVASLIEPKSLEPHEPSDARVHNFESIAGIPYNHPIEIPLSETISIACPRCVDPPRKSVPWWTSEGKGFAQDGFKEACAACKKSFTKATIGVRRLCDELTLRRSGAPIAFS